METTPLLWAEGRSPFAAFMRLSDWLYAREGRQHAIALASLMEELFLFLTTESAHEPHRIALTLWRDFQRGGRGEMPAFLRPLLPGEPVPSRAEREPSPHTTRRQERHRSTPG